MHCKKKTKIKEKKKQRKTVINHIIFFAVYRGLVDDDSNVTRFIKILKFKQTNKQSRNNEE